MVTELGKFENTLLYVAFDTPCPESLLMTSLLERQERVITAKESLVKAICDIIIPLPREAKKDVLGYCIKHISKGSLANLGAPWWAIHLYSAYNRNLHAVNALILYLTDGSSHMNYHEVKSSLTNLAKSYTEHGIEITYWKEVMQIVEELRYRRQYITKLSTMETLSEKLIENSIFIDSIHEIVACNVYSTIRELSDLFTYYSTQDINFHFLPTKIYDSVSNFCNSITLGFTYATTDKDLQRFVTLLKEIPLERMASTVTLHRQTKSTSTNHSPAPFIWNGKGTELLDLFITLEEKGFITLPGKSNNPGPTWEKVCRAICQLFDLSNFRRVDSKGEPWQTLETYFKTRSHDRLTGEERYDKLNYNKRKFSSISNRNTDLPGTD